MLPLRLSRRGTTSVLGLLLAAARAAVAQQPPPPPPPVTTSPPSMTAPLDSTHRAEADTLRGAGGFDGSRVRAGSWLYTTTLRSDTTVRLLGEVEVRVAESTYAGTPSWLLVQI